MDAVMIVDDDPDIREVFSIALAMRGLRVIDAASGPDALARLRSEPDVGLVLLDLMMPGMNGIEVIEQMKRDPQLSEVPVVVISGDPFASDKARRVGASGCLTKPVHLDVLLSLITRSLRTDPHTEHGLR